MPHAESVTLSFRINPFLGSLLPFAGFLGGTSQDGFNIILEGVKKNCIEHHCNQNTRTILILLYGTCGFQPVSENSEIFKIPRCQNPIRGSRSCQNWQALWNVLQWNVLLDVPGPQTTLDGEYGEQEDVVGRRCQSSSLHLEDQKGQLDNQNVDII